MRILVTGIAGFGGSGITKELLKRGYDVRGVDIIAPSHASSLRDVIDQIDYRWKNVIDMSREDLKGCDIVLHFCAQADVPMGFTSPWYTVYNNIMGTVSVLEACRGVDLEKVIIASSANAVQRPMYLPLDSEHPPNPVNPYGASKGGQELVAWAWNRSYGVPIVIYRNGVIYGPGMRKEIFIYKWLWNILHNKPCILEGGDQTRDPTFVSDTLDAWILGIEAEPENVVGEVFQISYGEEYKISEILEECLDAAGRRVPVIKEPYRPGEEGMREYFSIEKAKKILGYNPKVGLKEGLKKTVEWVATE